MSKGKLLLSDNDLDFLTILAEHLTRDGYEVVTANSSAEARRILEHGEIDLAILDIRLTNDNDENDITGLVLAKSIAPEIPKIIQTRFPTYEAVREALGSSFEGIPTAVDFVTKQEGPEALLTAIKSALKEANQKKEQFQEGNKLASITFLRRSVFALIFLLLALAAGIASMVFNNPQWLFGTVALSIIAVVLFALSSE